MKDFIINAGTKIDQFLEKLSKYLLLPLLIVSITTGCILMFGSLGPVALGIAGNVLLSLMIGAAAAIAATFMGLIFSAATKLGSSDLAESKERAKVIKSAIRSLVSGTTRKRYPLELFYLTPTAIGLFTLGAFIALTVTGLWAPVAMSTIGAAFAIVGASISLNFLVSSSLTAIRITILAFLPKPSKVTNSPSVSVSLTPSPSASNSNLLANSNTILSQLNHNDKKSDDDDDDDDEEEDMGSPYSFSLNPLKPSTNQGSANFSDDDDEDQITLSM